MKKLSVVLLGVVLLSATQACLDNKHSKNYNGKTTVDGEGLTFIKKGLEGGLTEIKASKLAKTNSTNPRVISFANMMIADHTQAGAELKKIEAEKRVDSWGDTISLEHKEMIDSLATKSGAAFDKAYIQMMIADHEKAVKLFTNGSENTSNLINDFSHKTLPTIKMHLNSAKEIEASLK